MPNFELEIEGTSVVAIGGFNPAIFHPSWFAANNLIRQEEADEAKVEHVTPAISTFEIGLFRVQVIPERLSFETEDPSGVSPLKDLCVATFSILEHTPIRAFGLNSNRHFKMESVDDWHKIGHYFTPKTTWEKLLDKPGMERITIQGQKSDCTAQKVSIRVEPSSRCENGVFVNVNQHYVFSDEIKWAAGGTSEDFANTLNADWDAFIEFRSTVSQTLFEDALSGKGS